MHGKNISVVLSTGKLYVAIIEFFCYYIVQPFVLLKHIILYAPTHFTAVYLFIAFSFLYAKRNCANSAPFNSIASRNFYMGVLKFPLSYVCDINTNEGEGQWDCHGFASKGVEFYMFKTSLECNKGEVVTTLCPGATELTRNG